jgi:hypothetical protein
MNKRAEKGKLYVIAFMAMPTKEVDMRSLVDLRNKNNLLHY